RIEVPEGGTIIARVTNAGAIPHDFVLDTGEGTPMLAPGETAEYTFGPFTDSTRFICSVPGHAAAGMVAEGVVTAPAGGTAGASGGASAHGAATPGGDFAVIDANAAPGSDGEARDPGLVPATGEGGTVHEITFRMTETVIE